MLLTPKKRAVCRRHAAQQLNQFFKPNIFTSVEDIIVRIASADDTHFAEQIILEMSESAKARGTGIARRSPEYLRQKMKEGKAVIALTAAGGWAGFCYIETWQHEKFVANSGLIVSPAFRKSGVAREIKKKIFELSRKRYPEAKIFGLTTGLAVMKINSDLGYEPVTYSELTTDEEFWKGCQSCVNFEILQSKQRKNCMCTAMLFDPEEEKEKERLQKLNPPVKHVPKHGHTFKGNLKVFERLLRMKYQSFIKGLTKTVSLF